ncbi:retropepsin-like aspartic protease [Thalassotalea nanhaiensis]|uniref:Retropepsin-like aspartic protease n=1 Tax=Thalassotalea nanhaiensis TaxID=3065648 RepID=A0ABY9TMF7_9GAMM|nr:retropepsin-like aspartic protease [Colwelliaceae bacterium SQ345]
MNVKLVVLLSILLTISIGTNIYLLKKMDVQTLTQESSFRHTEHNTSGQHNTDAISGSINTSDTDKNAQLSVKSNSQLTDQQSQELNLLIAKAEQLFFANQFIAAIDHLEQIAVINQTSSDLINEQWLAVGEQWVSKRKFSLLSSFLQAYLARFPVDEQWLQLKIEWLIAVNKPEEAISLYYQLIANAFNQDKEEIWSHQAHKVFQQYRNELKIQKAWQRIINFSKAIIANEVDYPPYQIALAEAYIHLNEIDTAINYLENIKFPEKYVSEINALNTLIDSIILSEEGVALNQHGQHFIVEATFNNQHTSHLMIDTGASLTVISTAFYQQLIRSDSIETKRNLNINTAGGNKAAFSIIIDEFWIAGRAVYDFEVVVMDLDGLNKADGLLGMNFLQHFKFEIDQQNALLFLSPH